jgi:hypothetical protein
MEGIHTGKQARLHLSLGLSLLTDRRLGPKSPPGSGGASAYLKNADVSRRFGFSRDDPCNRRRVKMKKVLLKILASLSMIFMLSSSPIMGGVGCLSIATIHATSLTYAGVSQGGDKSSTPKKRPKNRVASKAISKSSDTKPDRPTPIKTTAQAPGSEGNALTSKPLRTDNVKAEDDYTGLIIDATGLKIERSMSPKIRRVDGSVIWAGEDANPDFVIDKGIVGYAVSMSLAKENPRAGANPLIIRAVARYNGDNFHSDPEISVRDANLLIQEASKEGFLKKFNVIFVID